MRFSPLAVAAVVVPAALVASVVFASARIEQPSKVERGAYLVNAMACNDCHVPWTMTAEGPGPDMSRGYSGHPQDLELPPPPKAEGPWIASIAATNTAWAGPWGVSFTANLTPDVETGIGGWTEDQFVKTFRTGRRQGVGRELRPPMPIPAFRNLTDDDLKAMFAYLTSLPAVKNRVPKPIEPVVGTEGAAGAK